MVFCITTHNSKCDGMAKWMNQFEKIFEIDRLKTVDELQMVINEAPVAPTQTRR